MDDIDGRLRSAGRAFLEAAWCRLQDEQVVPLSRFNRFIEVGRDYFGDSIRSLAEYGALAATIVGSHSRFADDLPLTEREFPDGLIFSVLETFVARLSESGGPFSADGPAAEQSLNDLIQVVRADAFEVACCRVMSYMTTVAQQPVEFDDVRVEPVASNAAESTLAAHRIIEAVIPYSTSAHGRDLPGGYAPPNCVIIARASGPKPFDLQDPLSNRIGRFLLLVRLLKPGTSESMYEVQGETHPVREFKPIVVRFRGAGARLDSPTQLAARTITLGPEDTASVTGLGRLLDATKPPNSQMMFTSFDMALHKFTMSYHAHVWYEQIVDLATAFEATLSGKEKDDVTLRLKIRAATLLSTDRDFAENIFKDVGVIYGLRSKLVHGGAMKRADLTKEVRKVSTVPDNAPDGEALAHVVERLRDLVRRGLLARICLASGATPVWSLNSDEGVDAAMSDDARRVAWRESWRNTLASIDASAAAERPLHRRRQSSMVYDDDYEEREAQALAAPRDQESS